MSQPEEQVVEVVNNFRPVNDYIEHLLDRQRDLLAYRQFNRWRLIMIGASAVILSAGIAYLLYSIGIFILKKEESFQIIESVTSSETQTSLDSGATVKVEFTVFRTVTLPKKGEVVTGYNYDPSDSSYPKDQYCYIAISSSAFKSDNYHVARKLGRASVTWEPEVPSEFFEMGQQNCKFQN